MSFDVIWCHLATPGLRSLTATWNVRGVWAKISERGPCKVKVIFLPVWPLFVSPNPKRFPLDDFFYVGLLCNAFVDGDIYINPETWTTMFHDMMWHSEPSINHLLTYPLSPQIRASEVLVEKPFALQVYETQILGKRDWSVSSPGRIHDITSSTSTSVSKRWIIVRVLHQNDSFVVELGWSSSSSSSSSSSWMIMNDHDHVISIIFATILNIFPGTWNTKPNSWPIPHLAGIQLRCSNCRPCEWPGQRASFFEIPRKGVILRYFLTKYGGTWARPLFSSHVSTFLSETVPTTLGWRLMPVWTTPFRFSRAFKFTLPVWKISASNNFRWCVRVFPWDMKNWWSSLDTVSGIDW